MGALVGYPGVEELDKKFDCPNCGYSAWRESVDVGVGILFGPWGCQCGWSESDEYNKLNGPTWSEGGARTDQYGYLYPTIRKEDNE